MSRPEVDRAKVVCASCPVRKQCLRDSLENDDRWGIWGGYTAPERNRVREELGFIDVLNKGRLVPADVETVMEAYADGRFDAIAVLP